MIKNALSRVFDDSTDFLFLGGTDPKNLSKFSRPSDPIRLRACISQPLYLKLRSLLANSTNFRPYDAFNNCCSKGGSIVPKICIYVCVQVYVSIFYMHVCVHVYVYVCVGIYIMCLYTYIYV